MTCTLEHAKTAATYSNDETNRYLAEVRGLRWSFCMRWVLFKLMAFQLSCYWTLITYWLLTVSNRVLLANLQSVKPRIWLEYLAAFSRVRCWICSQEVAGLTLVVPLSCSYFGQIVHTHVTGQMSVMIYSWEDDCGLGGKYQQPTTGFIANSPACWLPTDLVFFDAHTPINYETTFILLYLVPFPCILCFLAFVCLFVC